MTTAPAGVDRLAAAKARPRSPRRCRPRRCRGRRSRPRRGDSTRRLPSTVTTMPLVTTSDTVRRAGPGCPQRATATTASSSNLPQHGTRILYRPSAGIRHSSYRHCIVGRAVACRRAPARARCAGDAARRARRRRSCSGGWPSGSACCSRPRRRATCRFGAVTVADAARRRPRAGGSRRTSWWCRCCAPAWACSTRSSS